MTPPIAYAPLLLRDDPRGEGDVKAEQIFRGMRAEQHPYGEVVGDVTNDSAQQRRRYVGYCQCHD